MERITCHELPDLFQGAADIFGEKKEELCEMDARMGDGDLGLTMQKGFGALPQLIRDNEAEGDIGKTLMKAGMKMAALVPSTMGTLMSSGIMEGGKASWETVPSWMLWTPGQGRPRRPVQKALTWGPCSAGRQRAQRKA